MRAKSTARMDAPRLDPTMIEPLLISDVAERLGISRTQTVRLDTTLEPVKTPRGVRVYSRCRVDELAGERAVRKAVR